MARALILSLIVVGTLSIFSNVGLAQGKYDGTWTANGSYYEIRLAIVGEKAQLFLKCGGAHESAFDFQVSSTGVIDTYIRTVGGRRHVTGQLPRAIARSW